MIWCSFLSLTRKGRWEAVSVTTPGNSNSSPFANGPPALASPEWTDWEAPNCRGKVTGGRRFRQPDSSAREISGASRLPSSIPTHQRRERAPQPSRQRATIIDNFSYRQITTFGDCAVFGSTLKRAGMGRDDAPRPCPRLTPKDCRTRSGLRARRHFRRHLGRGLRDQLFEGGHCTRSRSQERLQRRVEIAPPQGRRFKVIGGRRER